MGRTNGRRETTTGYEALKRTALTIGLAFAATAFVAALGTPRLTAAFSDTRTISFYNIHTKETIATTYKKDGKFVPDGLSKINWIMRDWRRNEQTAMDPKTIDILWEMHTELGSKEPIHIICGYRSRSTNDMLRRTVGGQASESQHITGKAVDVSFPDVPLQQMRYSALIREQGGVGYYPTSGIPFIHVDTGNVRHWPRLPRYELALLFPNGRSQHHPADGGSISPDDVKIAQAQHKSLATEIAGFFSLRSSPQPNVQVASAAIAKPSLTGVTKPAVDAPRPATDRVASLTPPPPAIRPQPRLMAEPKLVERPSRLTPAPSDADRSQLMTLVSLATAGDEKPPRLISGPVPASRQAARPTASMPTPITASEPQPRLALSPLALPRTSWTQMAALDPAQVPGAREAATAVLTDAARPGWGNGWSSAPAFDEEHPEELSYRPFPIAPLLTASASINEPALSRMAAPDVAKILAILDSPSAVPPMQFLPGEQTAEVMWAQQFQGKPVNLADSGNADGLEDLPTKLIPRGVKTSSAR
jgi:uncharacterized protein YcbK (DUF882 family)